MGSAQLHGLNQVIGMRTEAPRTEEIRPRLNRELMAKPGLEPQASLLSGQ